jgi:hypothetical protein
LVEAGAGFAVVLGFGRETNLGFAVGAFTAAGLAVVFLGALVMRGVMVWISLSLCVWG